MALNPHEIRLRFAPTKTDQDRVAIKDSISSAALDLALLIHELVPGSREESQAVKNVEIAVQWAHAGIDRRYLTPGERHATEAERRAAAAQHVEWDGTYRPALCGCGNPTHSPLIACPPPPVEHARPDRP